MTMELDRLAREIEPDRTVLFFGSGSSMPSGSPDAKTIASKIGDKFKVATDGFSLGEVAELAEGEADRDQLVRFVRSLFPKPKPTGGLLNAPLYPWKSIFTTNYDELIEAAYRRAHSDLAIYTTNFDFSQRTSLGSQFLFKIHGTIGHDVIDGSNSRLILTQGDYDKAEEYREHLFQRLGSDIAGCSLVIVGHSLADPDIKAVVDRALSIQSKMGGCAAGQIFLVLYERDENRARLYEARGLRVCFGGIDELFEAIARFGPAGLQVYTSTGDPLDSLPTLRATTIDVSHAVSAFGANVSAMFNGWPASYADVKARLTFTRTIANTIFSDLFKDELPVAVLLGASGVGKTTAVRQVALICEEQGWHPPSPLDLEVRAAQSPLSSN